MVWPFQEYRNELSFFIRDLSHFNCAQPLICDGLFQPRKVHLWNGNLRFMQNWGNVIAVKRLVFGMGLTFILSSISILKRYEIFLGLPLNIPELIRPLEYVDAYWFFESCSAIVYVCRWRFTYPTLIANDISKVNWFIFSCSILIGLPLLAKSAAWGSYGLQNAQLKWIIFQAHRPQEYLREHQRCRLPGLGRVGNLLRYEWVLYSYYMVFASILL